MESSSLVLILSLFTASFLGSWHCAAMCGPVACFISNQGNLKLYHFGRLISYVSLGVLAGEFGGVIFNHSSHWIYLTVILVVTSIVIISGLVRLHIVKWKFKKINLFKDKIFSKFVHLFQRWGRRSSFFVGVLTGFLPCSWLLIFVFSAVTTHSALAGGVVLFVFWLGDLPALISVSTGMSKLISKAPQYHQKVAAVVLIFAAVFSIISFATHLT